MLDIRALLVASGRFRSEGFMVVVAANIVQVQHIFLKFFQRNLKAPEFKISKLHKRRKIWLQVEYYLIK